MTLQEYITEREKLFDEIKKDFIAVKQSEWWSSDEDFIKLFHRESLKGLEKQIREECEKERWIMPCKGCPEGHPSFWKTITESEEWQEWEKEQNKRLHSKNLDGCFDYDESRGLGALGKEHWKAFINHIKGKLK